MGAGHSLTLNSLTDGDTAAASVADGGIIVAQDAALTSLDLILDDVGPATSTPNENIFIDIAGTAVYMCSSAGDYLVGITIAVDGGIAYAS